MVATRQRYYPELDGLRGIAISMVICCHYFAFVPGAIWGWTGVDLFFVLSGFLIAENIQTNAGENKFILKFYQRRINRILPLYFLTLLLVFLFLIRLNNFSVELNYYRSHLLYLATNLQNLLIIRHEIPSNQLPLIHFWSLSIEEIFYLTAPLIFLNGNSIFKTRLLISLLIAILTYRIACQSLIDDAYTKFQLSDKTRFDGLLIGGLLSVTGQQTEYKRTRLFSILGGILILIYLLICLNNYTSNKHLPPFQIVGYTLISTSFALLVHILKESKFKILTKLSTAPPLIRVGKLSYGIYVIHWPVYIILKKMNVTNTTYLPPVAISVIALLITIPLAQISYRYFESIFWKRNLD